MARKFEILASRAGPYRAKSCVPINVPVPIPGGVYGTGKKELPMPIGYARVSTPDQSFTLQSDALEQRGCTKVVQEVARGAKTARPALTAALAYMRAGDTLVVWRLDRLGRSLGQLIGFMQNLQSRQIGFQRLVEAIDTTTATGQFCFQITGALAELERNLIRERTLAGLARARCRGR
jgi:DNA invertase Pin-like site-specific DNA recombinase